MPGTWESLDTIRFMSKDKRKQKRDDGQKLIRPENKACCNKPAIYSMDNVNATFNKSINPTSTSNTNVLILCWHFTVTFKTNKSRQSYEYFYWYHNTFWNICIDQQNLYPLHIQRYSEYTEVDHKVITIEHTAWPQFYLV